MTSREFASMMANMSLPKDDKSRKELPVFTGPLMYFPDAMCELARVCKIGNDQHSPGEPMHWARGKSMNQMDTAVRHMMDHGTGETKDTDGAYHMAKAAWRCLAELQLTIERDRAASEVTAPRPQIAPAAKRWPEIGAFVTIVACTTLPSIQGSVGRLIRTHHPSESPFFVELDKDRAVWCTEIMSVCGKPELKIGDRVRVLSDSDETRAPGEVGVVVDVNSNNGLLLVKFEGFDWCGMRTQLFERDELEALS